MHLQHQRQGEHMGSNAGNRSKAPSIAHGNTGMWRQSGDNHQGSWFDPAREAIGRGRTFAHLPGHRAAGVLETVAERERDFVIDG